jgi:hypothetical protein
MKRLIVLWCFGFLVISASSVFAVDKLPASYFCKHDPAVPQEGELCELLYSTFEDTGLVNFDIDEDRPHFRFMVMPTMRDGYWSITIASNFYYPPLRGLALSAFISSYLLTPGGDNGASYSYMVGRVLEGTHGWMVRSGDILVDLTRKDTGGVKTVNLDEVGASDAH